MAKSSWSALETEWEVRRSSWELCARPSVTQQWSPLPGAWGAACKLGPGLSFALELGQPARYAGEEPLKELRTGLAAAMCTFSDPL